jgi:hypothetical protein
MSSSTKATIQASSPNASNFFNSLLDGVVGVPEANASSTASTSSPVAAPRLSIVVLPFIEPDTFRLDRGSQRTRRWRKQDSNPRSLGIALRRGDRERG